MNKQMTSIRGERGILEGDGNAKKIHKPPNPRGRQREKTLIQPLYRRGKNMRLLSTGERRIWGNGEGKKRKKRKNET